MKKLTLTKNILNENSESLQAFFKSIDKFHIYSGEEQIELARKAKAGDKQARELLINSNYKFVVTCAKKYTNQGVSLMDLIQSGIMGLIYAIENYDPDKGYKFLSFAVWYIRKEIIKSIYNHGRTIRYPISYISRISKVKKAYEDFLTKNQREPNTEELMNLTNLTQRQYDSAILNKSYCQSLDTPVSEDGDMTVEDTLIYDDNNRDPFVKDSVKSCLKILNSRERFVITKFYGLEDDKEYTIKEIAEELGLGEERVRQLRKGGIKKLKERCGNILKTLL